MQIGIALPLSTPALGPAMLADAGQAAEDLGFYSLWSFDRIFWAVNPRNPYAGRFDPWPNAFKYTFDPLDILLFLAAHTKRVKLGTSVINAPFYNPVLLARRLTTIDILSQGRLKVGLGLGWSEDEFEAVGVPMERRGARMDEFLRVMDAVWSEGTSSFQGEFYRLPESVFALKPVQQPRPTLLLGTFNVRGLRRAGTLADGWNPAGIGPAQIKQMGDIMREAAREAGRDGNSLEIVLRTGIDLRERPLGEERSILSGSAEQISEDLDELQAVGVTELFTGAGEIDPERGKTIDQFIKRLEHLSQLLA